MRYNELSFKWSGALWLLLLLQLFTILGTEVFGRRLSACTGADTAIVGTASFIAGAVISTVLWEAFLSCVERRIAKIAVEIKEPSPATLGRWARDFPQRIRHARWFMITSTAAITVLFAIFLATGVTFAVTGALCLYCIVYLIWASARPSLLKQFMEENIAAKNSAVER